MREIIACTCGHEMKRTVGVVTHVIFELKIKINNTPHYYCERCGTTTYDSEETNVVKLLREAYLDKRTVVEYK